ncbi:MAG: Eco57I restriction-modification methylase domain-containing protein [Oscillospiraceae bacterium]|jgi:tRNA1(Val) A37 N6-methylase TrmN6|nr:Eco57I restriction-modification methylase domain-containing protein [Oscillospiraceae bacterium]
MDELDLGQVFTKRIIADYMVSLFTLKEKSVVLDPCFGTGVFIDSIHDNTGYSTVGYELDNSLYSNYIKQNKVSKLINADFLLSMHDMKYDGIIMNPPYIRHEKIDELYNFGITKRLLQNEGEFSTLPKTANLYMYFIVKALNLLRSNGELVVIFPESWLNTQSGNSFKNTLEKRCSIIKCIHIKGNAFEQKKLVGVVILKLTKNTTFAECTPIYSIINDDIISERESHRLEFSNESKKPFLDYAYIRRGLTTGCNSIFINPALAEREESDYIVDIISSPKAVKGFSTENAITDKLLVVKKESLISYNLSTYLKKCEQEIITNKKPKTLAEKIKKGENWFHLDKIDCNGIIFGYIIRRDMRFIMNTANYLVRDNFYVINPKIEVNLLFALLNNYYVYTQLEKKGKNYGGGMLKLQKYDVSNLMLFDSSLLPKHRVDELNKLGVSLAKNGDKSIIEKITYILSEYDSIDFASIKTQYEYLQLKRLENI